MNIVKKWRLISWLEYAGTLFAAIGFSCLSFGYLLTGFVLGLLSTICLIIYFNIHKMKSLLLLQIFFFIVNLIGIYNNV